MSALIDLATGPLGAMLLAILGALGVWARGAQQRRKGRSEGRDEIRQEQVQDDMETIQRVRDAQDASRNGDDDWHGRLNVHRAKRDD